MNKHNEQRLISRPVRDLAWALQQPGFFSQLPETDTAYFKSSWQDKQLHDWLDGLDKDPSALLKHLEKQRSTRLGVYFEQLLSFYFEYYSRFELLAKNLQAFDGKRTLGEYDFIVYDRHTKQNLHIEVAVKFYTAQEPKAEIKNNQAVYNWHQWVGPNQRDTLGIKMRHLFEHQLQLNHSEAGQIALKNIGVNPNTVKKHLLLTGRLYLYKSDNSIKHPEHSSYPPQYYSFWVRSSEIENNLFHNENRYVILPRQLWMADINEQDIHNFSLECLPPEKIIDVINNNNDFKEFHIAEMVKENSIFKEKQRFFVL